MRVLISILKAVLGISGVVAYAVGSIFLLNSMAIIAHLADEFWFGNSIIGNDNAVAGFYTGVACACFGWGMGRADRFVEAKMIEHQTR